MTQKEEERGGRESLCCFLPSPSNKIAIQPLPLLLSFSPPPFSPLLKTCFSPFSSPSDPPLLYGFTYRMMRKMNYKKSPILFNYFFKVMLCVLKKNSFAARTVLDPCCGHRRAWCCQSVKSTERKEFSLFLLAIQKTPFFGCQEQPPSPSLTSGELEGGIKWNLTLCSSFTISSYFHWPYGPFSCSKSFKA